MKKYFLICTAVFSLSFLAAGGKGESVSDPGTASGEGRSIKISYQIQKNDEGSRSEGSIHILTINGYTLPYVFSYVYAADVPYVFEDKTQRWDDGGYIRNLDDKGTPRFEKSAREISEDDWTLGWYEGSTQKKGTPRSWVYVERENLKAFVNPDELRRFIEYEKPESIAKNELLAVP